MLQKPVWRLAAFKLALIVCCTASNVHADAIGFGWDAGAEQEKIYGVEFSTGAVTEIGVIPELKHLTLQGYDFDPVTGAVAVLGYPENSELGLIYVIDPIALTTVSFLLPPVEGNSFYQDTLINPADGFMYVLAYNNTLERNEIFRAILNPGTEQGDPATASLELITRFQTDHFSLGSPAIDSSGSFRILKRMDDGISKLAKIDLQSLVETEIALNLFEPHMLQNLVECNNSGVSSRIAVTTNYLEHDNEFFSVADDGTHDGIVATSRIPHWKVGSLQCTAEGVSLLGESLDTGKDTLFSLNAQSGEIGEQEFDSSNLKVIYQVNSSKVQSSQNRKAAAKVKTFKVVNANVIGKCGKKIKGLRNAHSLHKLVKVSRKLKFNARSCKRR